MGSAAEQLGVVGVVFEVFCKDTHDGDSLVVCGSSCALGDWKPDVAPALHGHRFPTWTSAGPSWVARGDLAELGFKFVIKRKSGEVKWEDTANRTMSALHARRAGCADGLIVVRATFGTEQGARVEWIDHGCWALWQHSVGKGGRWEDFAETVSGRVDRLFVSFVAHGAPSSVTFELGGRKYSVDFAEMQQRCLEDESKVRSVRRALAPPAMMLSIQSAVEAEVVEAQGFGAEAPELPDHVGWRLLSLVKLYAERLRRSPGAPLPAPPWRGVHADAVAALAAACVAAQGGAVRLECRSEDVAEFRSAVAARRGAAGAGLPPAARGAADGGIEARLERMAAAWRRLRDVEGPVAAPECVVAPAAVRGSGFAWVADVAPGAAATSAIDLAVDLAQRRRVALVNAANAYNPGGGFLSGGRSAMEEALCLRSTLFPTLARAARERLRQDEPYIPQGAALLSRGIRVDAAPPLDVISVAMPNLNRAVHNTPVYRESDAAYQRLLRASFRSVLQAASECRAQVLVVPECGCGVFQNSPSEVGRALGEELGRASAPRGEGGGLSVRLCGGREFADAVLREWSRRLGARSSMM